MWDEITYPFQNFHTETVEVWKRISNFIPLLLGMKLLMRVGIKVNPCYQKEPQMSLLNYSITYNALSRYVGTHV